MELYCKPQSSSVCGRLLAEAAANFQVLGQEFYGKDYSRWLAARTMDTLTSAVAFEGQFRVAIQEESPMVCRHMCVCIPKPS